MADRPTPRRVVRVARNHLRVPWRDWSLVITGEKRQFRQSVAQLPIGLTTAPLPSPVIAFTARPRIDHYQSRLMVLEGYRFEPLGAISPADLEREGFPSIKEFRRYWNSRTQSGRGFDPLMKVAVADVRPWEPGDAVLMGRVMLHHVYGEFLHEVEPEG